MKNNKGQLFSFLILILALDFILNSFFNVVISCKFKNFFTGKVDKESPENRNVLKVKMFSLISQSKFFVRLNLKHYIHTYNTQFRQIH